MGKTLFLSIWMPFVMLIFALSKQLQDDKGRAPKWFAPFSAMVFKGMWVSYDGAFKKVFGDGERTVGDEALGRRVEKEMRVEEVEEEGLLEEAFVRLDKQAMRNGVSPTRERETV
jgi:hypothetical protein